MGASQKEAQASSLLTSPQQALQRTWRAREYALPADSLRGPGVATSLLGAVLFSLRGSGAEPLGTSLSFGPQDTHSGSGQGIGMGTGLES